jgi:hypothetical protein
MNTIKPDEQNVRNRSSLIIGILAGLGYGLFTRLAFGMDANQTIVSTLSWGFLTFMPLGVGALTVFFGPQELRTSYRYAALTPWLTSLVFLVIVSALAFEAIICLMMAAPLFAVMTSIGGVVTCWILRQVEKFGKGKRQGEFVFLAAIVLAPYLITPLENQMTVEDAIRKVDNQIVINTSVETVWQNIIRVPEITPAEHHFSLFHVFGVPKPVEATLSQEGIGGVRHASFEQGLVFVETITNWRDQEMLRFTINPDTQADLPAPFNAIGGAYFDVIDGTYVIEPVNDNQVILHLSSTHRLSTRLNAYGTIWTDFIMSDLQNYILQVIKERAEKTG